MIPPDAFSAIQAELQRKPLPNNFYRKKTALGRSQAFGLVNRRSLPVDYSRNCWQRAYLYKLLLDFGNQYATDISWNTITVNASYQAGPHRDRGNTGLSFLVAFGDYEGGALKMHEGPQEGLHDIRHSPIIGDFGANLHSVLPFKGERYSLVYYTIKGAPPDIPPPSVRQIDGIWHFFRGDSRIDKREGLQHPLKGRTKQAAQ